MNTLRCILMTTMMLLFFTGITFSQIQFTSKLTSEQEVHAVTSQASGTGVFILSDNSLEYSITVNNMSVQAAHIHMGKVGVDGEVVKTLTADFNGNTATGIWTSTDNEPFTEVMVEALLKGELYVNIHSLAHPNGEIRGQIISNTGTVFTSVVENTSADVSSETEAMGTGTLLVTEEGAAYSFTFSGATANSVEIHSGNNGNSTGMIYSFSLENNSAVGVWTKYEGYSETYAEAMLKGETFLQVNSSEYSEGELKGNLELNGGLSFSAELSGSNVVPPVESNSSGTAMFTLTNSGLVYEIAVDSVEFNSAAFFKGSTGANGELMKDISADFEGNTAVGVWTTFDVANPITADIMADLADGNIYLSITSDSHTEGELRGQVTLNTSAAFSVRLYDTTHTNGNTELKLKGIGKLELTNEGLEYRVTAAGSSAMSLDFQIINDNGDEETVNTVDTKIKANTFAGVWTKSDDSEFNDAYVKSMLEGKLVVDVNNENSSEGEYAGYVETNGGVSFTTQLFAEQETGVVESDAFGTAFFKLIGDNLFYVITVENVDVNAAHFHHAEMGAEGLPIKTITADFNGNTAIGVWTSSDSEPLTSAMVEALLKGDIYVNIHSSSNPTGEIRGQLNLNSGIGFYSKINSENVNPSIDSEASGTGSFILTSYGLIYDISLSGITLTSSNIHLDDGSIAASLMSDFELNTGSGVWLDDNFESSSTLNALFKGETYVNFTSVLFPEGESRGDVTPAKNSTPTTNVNNTSEDSIIPERSTLNQNYPNPFNPSTTIKFALPNNADVELSVYNIIGQKVATLINSNLGAGSYEVNFDASSLSSGIYFYSLTTNNKSLTKKMQLIK